MRLDAPDVIAVVEAAYELADEEPAWLLGVLERLRPIVDADLGMSAWCYEIHGRRVDVRSPVSVGVPDRLGAVLLAANDEIPVEAYLVGPVATLSEVIPASSPMPSTPRIVEEFGMRDVLRASITDPSGQGVAFAAFLTKPRSPPRAERLRLSRVAAHLHTALRARLRREPDADDAVLRPDGRVEHAEGDAKDRDARAALREAARRIDRSRGRMRRTDPDGALDAWRALVDGRWTLLDRFESDGRRFLVARRNEPRASNGRGLTPSESACAIYAAMGHSQKLIAYELGIGEPTVSTHVRRAMRKLGVKSRAELARAFGAPA